MGEGRLRSRLWPIFRLERVLPSDFKSNTALASPVEEMIVILAGVFSAKENISERSEFLTLESGIKKFPKDLIYAD